MKKKILHIVAFKHRGLNAWHKAFSNQEMPYEE